jgi:putative membrane protein insertion efficiency factor
VKLLKRLLSGIILFYQRYISKFTPPTCRFYPTCSHYGLEAIKRFGPFKGSFLTVIRIFKCNPFHPGGFDSVPEKKENK